MRTVRRTIAVAVGSLALSGLLPLSPAHADEVRLFMQQWCYDRAADDWWHWSDKPLTVRAGVDAVEPCRIRIDGPGAGTPGAKLELTLSAASVEASGYAPEVLARMLAVRTADPRYVEADTWIARRWIVGGDGSLTLDLPPFDMPVDDVAGVPVSSKELDIEISGAPMQRSFRLDATARLIDASRGATTEAALGIDVVGNGGTDEFRPLSTFVPSVPARLLDTRSGIGARQGWIGRDSTLNVRVAGRAGIPATGVTAVVLNVTATDTTGAGFLTVYPHGTLRPLASSVNFVPGQTVANQVTVPVGEDGTIDVYNRVGTVDVLADISGWYTAQQPEASRYTGAFPTRLLDTRSGTGAPKAPVGPDGTVNVKVTGRAGVPATGVTAVVLNVTATGPTAASFLTAYPHGASRPTASNLNVVPGRTVANQVTVPVGPDGTIDVYNHTGTVDVLADISGWYGATGSRFVPHGPIRILDTRTGRGHTGQVGPANNYACVAANSWDVGVPPFGVTDVVLNVTATGASQASYGSVWGTAVVLKDPNRRAPVVSHLNYGPGETVANAVTTTAPDCVHFDNHAGTVDMIADMAGYFTSL